MRCNVDVKYIGRAFAEEDLSKFCDGSMSSDVDESHTDGVHEQGVLRPVVPQPVAGSLQPELSERDPSDMDWDCLARLSVEEKEDNCFKSNCSRVQEDAYYENGFGTGAYRYVTGYARRRLLHW